MTSIFIGVAAVVEIVDVSGKDLELISKLVQAVYMLG